MFGRLSGQAEAVTVGLSSGRFGLANDVSQILLAVDGVASSLQRSLC